MNRNVNVNVNNKLQRTYSVRDNIIDEQYKLMNKTLIPKQENDIDDMINYDPNRLLLLLELKKISSIHILSHFLTSLSNDNMYYIYVYICKNKFNQYLDDGVHFLMKTSDLIYAIIYERLLFSLNDTYILKEDSENKTLDIRYKYLNHLVLNRERQELIDIILNRYNIFRFDDICENKRKKMIKYRNIQILSYFDNTNHIPTIHDINEIIYTNWIIGIKYLLDSNQINQSFLIYHLCALKTNDISYWKLLQNRYSALIDIDKIKSYNICQIKYLFPLLYDSITEDQYIDIILSDYEIIYIAYILGFNIYKKIPTYKGCKKRLKEIYKVGYKKYYKKLRDKQFNKIQKNYSNIVNTENALFEDVYSYSPFDIICVEKTQKNYLNEKSKYTYIFTRSEFNSMITDNKELTNFYTRESIENPTKEEFYQKIIFSNSHTLPQSMPLTELFEIYLIPPIPEI